MAAFVGSGVTSWFAALIGLAYVVKQPAHVNKWEVLMVLMLWAVRALSLGVKYAFYGDRDTASMRGRPPCCLYNCQGIL